MNKQFFNPRVINGEPHKTFGPNTTLKLLCKQLSCVLNLIVQLYHHFSRSIAGILQFHGELVSFRRTVRTY